MDTYEKQNNLRKPEVFLSSSDRNFVCDIIVSLHMLSHIHILLG